MVSGGNSEILITRDLLGELSKGSNRDLDLDLQVPKVWEMPHDSKPGMVYPLRCNPSNSAMLSFNNEHHTQMKATQELNLLEEGCLELGLVPNSSQNCPSVCTLDKVKSALVRAEQESSNRKRSEPLASTARIKEGNGEARSESNSTGMFAAACPGCLLYVITLKANPRCPRCNSKVPSPLPVKKPRIDLNASF